MGSGKGRARRTRAAAATTAKSVIFNARSWKAFVKNQGLRNVKLVDYYQVTSLDTSQEWSAPATQQAQANLAKELLRDLVATGTLVLPRGVHADDFNFIVDARKYSNWSNHKVNCLVMQRGKKEEIVEQYPGNHLNERTKLSNYNLQRLMSSMSSAAQQLVQTK